MSNDLTAEQPQLTARTADIEDAYLAIPDERNPAIVDARKTYMAVVILAVLFVGSAALFVL